MAKSPAQLDREIAQSIGLPPEVVKKWRAKIATYKRTIAALETGYSEDAFDAVLRARNGLDKMLNEAAAHVPYVAGQSPYLSAAYQALSKERDALVSSTWQQAQEKGRAANYRQGREKIKRLEEEQRAIDRPYDWMRR